MTAKDFILLPLKYGLIITNTVKAITKDPKPPLDIACKFTKTINNNNIITMVFVVHFLDIKNNPKPTKTEKFSIVATRFGSANPDNLGPIFSI